MKFTEWLNEQHDTLLSKKFHGSLKLDPHTVPSSEEPYDPTEPAIGYSELVGELQELLNILDRDHDNVIRVQQSLATIDAIGSNYIKHLGAKRKR